MKKIIFALLLVFTFSSAFAATGIEGTVTDVVCGEMDPFAVGDTCVVFSTHDVTGAKLGLVFRDYDWFDMFVNEPDSETDTVGDSFTAQYCEKIGNPGEIEVLKGYNSDYFYLNCDVNGFSWR